MVMDIAIMAIHIKTINRIHFDINREVFPVYIGLHKYK